MRELEGIGESLPLEVGDGSGGARKGRDYILQPDLANIQKERIQSLLCQTQMDGDSKEEVFQYPMNPVIMVLVTCLLG